MGHRSPSIDCFNRFPGEPTVQTRDIKQLLSTDGSISLQAANRTDIPYCGWVEMGVRLTNENETDIGVPFLATKEDIEQSIIDFNVIELMVRNMKIKKMMYCWEGCRGA